ncbi:cytochrome c oxidase assembly protein [Pseudoduganella sp. RAF53_2]|uniref:cytochrome c oxidase assembly protein n=1 Tax=unclassified Pseudoduganella TaxID=2637179 RepID=UPI003F9BDE35
MSDKEVQGAKNKLLGKLLVVAVMMFGFGYALIPVYKHLCEVLGLNLIDGKPEAAAVNSQVDKSRSITVDLVSNVQGTLRFRPTVNSVTVHPGELTTVVYEVVNSVPRTVKAQAIPSYTPQEVTPHFKKIECFCFKEQILKPNEARQMPVVFFIDPAVPKSVKTVTLSYTFIEAAGLDNKTASN